jgi:plasmid maintenance system antidote protein VapI
MQQTYDLWHVEQRLKDELTKIEPMAAVNSGA